jgi:micrococcal nuclease
MNSNKIIKIIVVLSIAIILQSCSSNVNQPKPTINETPSATQPVSNVTAEPMKNLENNTNKKLIDAKIVKVVDGDTMDILINNKKETVRLLLVDTPETVHPTKPVEPFGPEASKFAKETLTGKDIKIEMDVSDRDKYGRLLAYLYIDNKMFNEMLLEKGLARVAYVYPPNIKYVDHFRDIQKKAQVSGIGIWSIENYAQEDGFHPVNDKQASNKAPQDTIKPTKETSNPVIDSSSNVHYKSCTEVKNAGKAPIHKGEPGYSTSLDRDGDGIACEK